MQKSILFSLEENSRKYPDKIIFSAEKEEITYQEFVNKARSIGDHLASLGYSKKNAAIFIDKSINCLLAMFGAMYANACYTIIDVKSPGERIRTITDTFCPACIITDSTNMESGKNIFGDEKTIIVLDEAAAGDPESALLEQVRNDQCDTDPMYVLFTSGSTGVPKGTVICQRSVIDYADSVCRTFDIDENTVWGSQTPFYFSMSVLDIFTTIYNGASLVIIPKRFFSFPIILIRFLNERKVNAIYWVPTAMDLVADFDAFSEELPVHLKKILFAGEVMPVKQLNYWISRMPDDCIFANLYGPTEITDTGTYYIVDRTFDNAESLPIGKHFDNCDVFVINSDGQLVTMDSDDEGELYVRGSFVGLGYYNNPEKTAEMFVQNPLNKSYPEIVYRTGDIVKYNNLGELLYIGRRDHQIKHMGHRIELGEIEARASSIDDVERVCSVYDDENKEIVLFYVGNAAENDVSGKLISLVPGYMYPQRYIQLSSMPLNMNGKIDRVALKKMINGEN